MKKYLDSLAAKYETKEFIEDDPILFAHRYKNKNDAEIASFIAALFAFGKREAFIQKLNFLFDIMCQEPYNYILEFKGNDVKLKNFVYRFVHEPDIIALLSALNKLYTIDKMSLEELFFTGLEKGAMFQFVTDYFYGCLKCPPQGGFCHLFARPEKGGAMKRLNMLLRWMIRKGPVDLGMWNFMKPSQLLIPLDVHVGKISRSLGLLHRNANDFKAVLELTEKLREFDPRDPIKYDFALFGAGVNAKNVQEYKLSIC